MTTTHHQKLSTLQGPAYKRANLPFYAVCGEIPELTTAEETTAANLSTIRKISKMMQHGTHERAKEADPLLQHTSLISSLTTEREKHERNGRRCVENVEGEGGLCS